MIYDADEMVTSGVPAAVLLCCCSFGEPTRIHAYFIMVLLFKHCFTCIFILAALFGKRSGAVCSS